MLAVFGGIYPPHPPLIIGIIYWPFSKITCLKLALPGIKFWRRHCTQNYKALPFV